MKELAAVLAVVLIAALTYTLATYLMTGGLSETKLGPLLIAMFASWLTAWLIYKPRRKKSSS